MKRFIILFLISMLAVDMSAVITKKVLVMLKQNEVLGWGEYISNFRVSQHGFICVLYDRVQKKETLVWNGERKICVDELQLEYIDMDDYDKCIYRYNVGNEWYIRIEKDIYGPYDYIRYSTCYPMLGSNSDVVNTKYLHRREFEFSLMGESFIHDDDGTIYKSSEGKYEFVSPDRLHRAVIAKDIRIITIDNVNYVIPIPVDLKKIYSPNICLFNDGTCYLAISCRDTNDSYNEYCYYITPSEVRPLNTQTEYFDLDSQKILPKSQYRKSKPVRDFWELSWGYDSEKEESFIKYDFSFQDKTKRHFFNSNWNCDYVMIDGKKYGNKCPIDAFYDSVDNSFGWVVVEGNQIVLYNYQL